MKSFKSRFKRPIESEHFTRELNVIYPKKLNYTHSIRDFINQIYDAKRAGFEEFIIDFSRFDPSDHSYFPNILVPLASFIDYLNTSGEYTFELRNAQKNLEHTNFISPQHTGLTGNYPSVLDKVWLFDSPEDVFKLVTEYMDAIYKIDTFSSKDVLNWLEWCLNEVMDNVIQHSDVSRGVIMGQVHPTTKHIAFCIADAGRGIYESLRTSTEFWPHDAEDALVLALKEGVTRDKNVGQGNGLWGLHEVAIKSAGRLRVASGGKMLVVDEKGQIYNYPFFDGRAKNGTIIDFQLDYSAPIILTDILNGHQPDSAKIVMNSEDGDGKEVRYPLANQKSGFGTRKSGERIRNEVKNILLNADNLVIDFEGIGIISSSFADELIGKIYLEMGPIGFSQKITLANMNSTIAAIINKAILQRVSQGI